MSKLARVLVVDDQRTNLDLMEAMLVPLGYRVALAMSGEEALRMVAESPPDVILLDVMMPGLDGLEMARRLKADKQTRIIPIVMVTALREKEDRVRAWEAGADDFISKPVDRIELTARVASLVKVKQLNDLTKAYQLQLENEVAKQTAELQEALAKIKAASLDTIHRLSMAAEFKDEDTGAHIFRIGAFAAAIARHMGCSEAVVSSIRYASPMHDVGKIGIPDNILLKPDKLSTAEWTLMRQHTTIGARILSGAAPGFLKLAQVVAETHHERWDGGGYPHGLKGRETPLAGRIVAIADVFDALTSKRPYKEAWPVPRALEIVAEERGKQFDPKVVDAFMAIKDEIMAIKEACPDDGVCLLAEMKLKTSI